MNCEGGGGEWELKNTSHHLTTSVTTSAEILFVQFFQVFARKAPGSRKVAVKTTHGKWYYCSVTAILPLMSE